MSDQQAIKTMKKLLEANTAYGVRRISQVFRDFCELTAIALRNAVDREGWAEREKRYLQVISPYTTEEADRFAQIMAILAAELERERSDVLGHLYMSLDLGSDEMGQFFTPYHVSQLVAGMASSDIAAQLAGKNYVTVSEPTCGSGGMIVAQAEQMRSNGLNYQQQLHVTAQDIEITSVHMTYIALSLLYIPGVVIHGDTLTMEVRDQWFTPAHILGGWSARLRSGLAAKNGDEQITDVITSGSKESLEDVFVA